MDYRESHSYCLGLDSIPMSNQLSNKNLSLDYVERNDFMTLICGKYDKDSIILGCDSLVTTNTGRTYKKKYFINKEYPLAVLYAGCSMIQQQNGKILYIGDVIQYDINKYNGQNIFEIKETLINDIIRFLPRNDDFFGQFLIAYQADNQLKLEGYEVNVKKDSKIDEYNIFKNYDSNSYYFHPNEIASFGIVSSQEINQQYQLNKGNTKEKVRQLINHFIRDWDYSMVGGEAIIIELTNKGINVLE